MPGITASIPLEMCYTWFFNDIFDVLWTVTELEIDPADYPGLTHAWFEVVADSDYCTAEDYIKLVDAALNVYATITVPADTRETRFKVEFELNPVKTKYYVFTPAANGEDNWLCLDWYCARVWLDVEEADRLRIQIPLIMSDWSTGGGLADPEEDNLWAWVEFTSSTSYGYGNYDGLYDNYHRLFYKDDAKWSTIDHWEFEVRGCVSEAESPTDTGYCALFNKTTGLMVDTSELTWTEQDDPTLKRASIANDATNFDSGCEFEFRIKIDNDNAWFIVYSAILYAVVDPLTKVEVHMTVANHTNGSTAGAGYVHNDKRYNALFRLLYDIDKFGVGSKFFFECTARETGGDASLYLSDCYENDVSSEAITQGCTTVTEVSGSWSYPDNIKTIEYDGLPATTTWVTLDIPNATAELELSGFGFDALIPDGATIQNVDIQTIVGMLGQTSQMCAYAVVGGVAEELHCSSVTPNWVGGTQIQEGRIYTLTSDRVWTKADLLDANFKIRVQAKQPNNSVETTYYWNWAGVQVSLGSMIVESKLDFSTSVRERQRTAEITSYLTDEHRYIIYVSATSTPLNKIATRAPSYIIAELEGELEPIEDIIELATAAAIAFDAEPLTSERLLELVADAFIEFTSDIDEEPEEEEVPEVEVVCPTSPEISQVRKPKLRAGHYLRLIKGDSTKIFIRAIDPTSPETQYYDLTGAIIRFTIKQEFWDADDLAWIRKSSEAAGEIDITNAVEGRAVVNIASADSVNVKPWHHTLWWDIQITKGDETYTTRGIIDIDPDVTFVRP